MSSRPRAVTRIFSRLAGLETEYAIRLRTADDEPEQLTRPPRFRRYQFLIDALRRRVLAVEARHFKDGVFTANGGAVWFEAEKPASGGGLIEGATPECRGPRELLRYQRAQDKLLGEAAVASGFQLIKNDRDAWDNVYGAQENYDVVMASGWRLWCWRIGLAALLPVILCTWVAILSLIPAMLLYLAAAGLTFVALQFVVRDPDRLALNLFGSDLVAGRETGGPTPVWMEDVLLWLTRVITAPLACSVWLLAYGTTFVPIRRKLMPLLVSRAILCGSGMIDRHSRFHLADKAPAMNCEIGYGGFLFGRPIITIGHFFKALCVESCFSPRDLFDLFRRRQRLQIALGDSNMSETAEYLRVGTTMLVLDMLEAGEFPADPPRLWRPIRALHRICGDPTLQTRVPVGRRRQMTALDIQWWYWEACAAFVARHPDASPEAHEVLRLWRETLGDLESLSPGPITADCPLLGRVDWVTKKFLMEQIGDEADWESLKKVDIRYHELSEDGYYRELTRAGVTTTLIDGDELDRSVRTPPPDSPATARGHYIREFSQGDEPMSVNWKTVVLGRGRAAKVVRLSKYLDR